MLNKSFKFKFNLNLNICDTAGFLDEMIDRIMGGGKDSRFHGLDSGRPSKKRKLEVHMANKSMTTN